MSKLLEDLYVVLAPALAMLVGSSFALCLRVPERIQACFQNFSAGLLLSAVAAELYPLMSPKSLSKGRATLAVAIGFVLALIFMFGLEYLTEADEDEQEGDKEKEAEGEASPVVTEVSQPVLSDYEKGKALKEFSETAGILKDDVIKIQNSIEQGNRDKIDTVVHGALLHVHQAERQLAVTGPLSDRELDRMKFHGEELRTQSEELGRRKDLKEQRRALKVFSGILEHIHEHTERKRFHRWKPAPIPARADTVHNFSEKLPWPLIASVAADGAVDGILIGLAFAASPAAGWAMSTATCIEMAFLGLSFCATICNATRSLMKRLSVAVVPPLLLLAAGVAGTRLGDALRGNLDVFVGFIGFSVVCLLFLVTQELLAEAREAGGDNALISSMFFIGLFGGIVLENFS